MLGIRPKTSVVIRWRIARDIPAMLAIEEGSFEYPMSEDMMRLILRGRHWIGMVAEHRGRVVGFMIYELHKTTLQLWHIAVHPEFRRAGVGRQMLDKLVGKLCTHRMTRITLTVRETNLAAQQFYRSCGFTATGVARGYYRDTGEDGYEFAYALADHTD